MPAMAGQSRAAVLPDAAQAVIQAGLQQLTAAKAVACHTSCFGYALVMPVIGLFHQTISALDRRSIPLQ